MNSTHRFGIVFTGFICLALAGCHAPGKPGPEPEIVRPEQVLEFNALYQQNCAACHGEQGRRGIAVSLADPVYLALAGRDVLIDATAKGGPKRSPGALMPAFAKKYGGALTDQQVAILADGILARWGKPGILAGQTPPPYAATATGDAVAGKADFIAYCVRCHRDAALPEPAASSLPVHEAGPVTNPNYLALISDQSLRSTILAGRPDDGMPDWRSFAAHPLSDQEVGDLVAWLASQRRALSNQPPAVGPAYSSQNSPLNAIDAKTKPATTIEGEKR